MREATRTMARISKAERQRLDDEKRAAQHAMVAEILDAHFIQARGAVDDELIRWIILAIDDPKGCRYVRDAQPVLTNPFLSINV